MSVINEKFVCDGCGADVGNGGVDRCAIVSRIDLETGHVENLHLCMTGKWGPDGKLEDQGGCSVEILNDKALTHYSTKLRKKLRAKFAPKRGDRSGSARGSDVSEQRPADEAARPKRGGKSRSAKAK